MGGLCGVAALLLQNLADLGLELGSVGIALSVVLGSLWGSVKPPTDRRTDRPRSVAWGTRFALALGTIALPWCLQNGLASVDEDRSTVKALIGRAANERSAAANDRLNTEIVRMLRRHPADYYFPLAGAYAARMQGRNPMPWIQRSLERGPNVG